MEKTNFDLISKLPDTYEYQYLKEFIARSHSFENPEIQGEKTRRIYEQGFIDGINYLLLELGKKIDFNTEKK
jgi:hypothetical protein